MDTNGRADLRGDEAELFRGLNKRLLRSVGRAVNAPEAIVEEACGFAWLRLIERQPERTERIFAWLRKVAIREAWRLARTERREDRLEELGHSGDQQDGTGWESLIASERRLEDALEARRALRLLASLSAKQRNYLTLLIAGFSYAEIQALGSVSHTNVNKHLVKARARIRRHESEAA